MIAGPGGAPVALRTRDVADLTVASGFPCISVLLPTTPASRMTAEDRRRLHELVADVEAEMVRHGVLSPSSLLAQLHEHVESASDHPTDRGLCIYVSQAVARSFRLPESVDARAVVESTFATRPLIAALHRMPPHVVLLLHPTCAHLYAAEDGGLRSVGRLEPFGAGRSIRLPGARQPASGEARAELMGRFLHRVDQMLGDYRTDHPSPLVLVGPPSLVEEFCARSGNLERLAGRIDDRDCATPLDLALAGITAVETYLRNRRDDALAQLRRAADERAGAVVSGLENCWRAVGSRRPAMLLVEQNFISPGVSARSHVTGLMSSGRAEVHDLVDDLMEHVILQGGQLALVADGDLVDHDRVALILRR